jgi:hypothetical protein
MRATPEQRAEIITGLREVADFLDAHPELPVERHWGLSFSTWIATGADDEAGTAMVDEAAAILGTEPTGGSQYAVTRTFSGGVYYEVLRIASSEMSGYQARMARLREMEDGESTTGTSPQQHERQGEES